MWKIQIPKTESKVEEATLFKWHKKEGDRVIKGELIAEIETFKAAVEINSPEDGIFYKILIEEGETVPINTVIAILAEEGEEISPEDIKSFLRNQKKDNTPLEEEKSLSSRKDMVSGNTKKEKFKIAPVARRLAFEKGVDLFLINGSGPAGAITKKDIEEYLSKIEEKTNFTIKEVRKLIGVQKIIAERLTHGYKNIPQFTLCRKIDVSSVLNLKKDYNAQLNHHLSLIDFIIKALVIALKKLPEFNAVFEGENYKFIKEININLAVAAEKGLMVPALKNLEEKNIFEIAKIRRDITEKTLEGKLQPQDFEEGTFTLTNLGLQGIEYFTPLINPPQVAILGMGKTENISLPLSLTMDHRILDGSKGANFLQFISGLLAHPLENLDLNFN